MNTIEKTAKTVDEAIAEALAELGIDKDDAEIEILDEGSRGFLGLGGKEASVRVTAKSVSPAQYAEKYCANRVQLRPIAPSKTIITQHQTI